MSLAVRDASLVTQKNRNKAINAYYQDWKANTVNSSSPKPGITGPATTSAETLTEAKLGCVACYVYNNSLTVPNPDPNQPLYAFNPSSGGAGRTY